MGAPPSPTPPLALHPEELLSRLVDALVTLAPENQGQRAAAPVALLVQKNRRDAALLIGGDKLLVLLACHPAERPGGEIAGRVERALASERPDVLRGLRESTAIVALIGGAASIAELAGALPAVSTTLEIALSYCRIAAGTVEQPAIPAAATDEQRDRIEGARRPVIIALTAALAALDAGHTAPASGEQLAASERAGEHRLAAEGVFARRLDELWPFAGVLGGALVLMWIAELVFGWGDGAVLSRMGSSLGTSVRAGQWWKLLCAGWLHAGLAHLAGNLMGLALFLAPVTAAIGRRRTFVLYALSCAGGFALAAWVKPDEDGVGASGGIFGLMAATLCLGLQRTEYMPRSTGCGWAGFAAIYLILNLLSSLKGGVSMLGHLGGGLTGAALVLGRLITLGLPTLDAGPLGGGRHWRPRRAWGGALSSLAVAAIAGVTLWAFGIQLSRERPWVVRWPPPVIEASFDDTPYAISVPRSLAESMRHDDDGASHEYTLGTLRLDPIAVAINVRARGRDLPASLDAERTFAALRARYNARWNAKVPGDRGDLPTLVIIGDRRWLYLLAPDGWVGDRTDRRYITADADHEIDVIVYLDGEANRRWIEAAEAVLPSLRRTAEK